MVIELVNRKNKFWYINSLPNDTPFVLDENEPINIYIKLGGLDFVYSLSDFTVFPINNIAANRRLYPVSINKIEAALV